MKLAIAHLQSKSTYSQSRKVQSEKGPRETSKDYEARTWKERCHVDADTGALFIPAMAFANSLKEAAKYLSIQVPGQGKATFTKNFAAGVMVLENMPLPVKLAEVKGEWFFVPSDGKPGGGKRVDKCFPAIMKWEGIVKYYIIDDLITEDVFRRVLAASGALIGIGRFRPINRGTYGRFDVVELRWEENVEL